MKAQIRADAKENGLSWLQSEVQKSDPLFWDKGETQNPHRLIRALEVIRGTGKSITVFRKNIKKEREFEIVKYCLELPRETLYERINMRTDIMRDRGLTKEAAGLFPFRNLNALHTVGYSELFSFFDNEISEDKAFELIKQHTRNYAKRQVTWFKKEGFQPVEGLKGPTDLHRFITEITDKIK